MLQAVPQSTASLSLLSHSSMSSQLELRHRASQILPLRLVHAEEGAERRNADPITRSHSGKVQPRVLLRSSEASSVRDSSA